LIRGNKIAQWNVVLYDSGAQAYGMLLKVE